MKLKIHKTTKAYSQRFYQALNSFEKSDLDSLIKIKRTLIAGVAEKNLFNQPLEVALLIKIYEKTGQIDNEIYSRSFFKHRNLEDYSILTPLKVRKEPAAVSPRSLNILFLSSKFDNFVSSQEYYREILLELLNKKNNIYIASTKKISEFYKAKFDWCQFTNFYQFKKLLESKKIDKIVDLSGEHRALLAQISNDVHIASVSGALTDEMVSSSSILWKEHSKYHNLYRNRSYLSNSSLIFLLTETAERRFPIIKREKKLGDPIIFGAFCRTIKLDLPVISLWAEIMREVNQSRLQFAYIQSNTSSEKFIQNIFQDLGISPERISFYPRLSTSDYLNHFNKIDINLGSMPEQGGISCIDSLVMGCPYLVCSELSMTSTAEIVMHNAGADRWIANTVDEYKSKIFEISKTKENFSVEERLLTRNLLLSSTIANGRITSSEFDRFLSLAI